MITSKTIVIAALATTPAAAAAAAAVAPTLDTSLIIAALIGAIPSTLGVIIIYFQGRSTRSAVDGVVTKLLTTNTEKAKAEAEAAAAPKLLKLSKDKATAEATIATTRAEQARQDKAAKGVVIIGSRRRASKPKTKRRAKRVST